MKYKQVFLATITNLSFWLSAATMYLLGAVAPAIQTFVLGIMSGIHHWNLGTQKLNVEFGRKLDYYGMYSALLSAILLGFGLSFWWVLILSTVIGLLITRIFGSSRPIIGGLIGLLFGLVVYWFGPFVAHFILAIASIAYLFNFLGETSHFKQHSPVHGIGWHNVISFALSLTVAYITGSITWLVL